MNKSKYSFVVSLNRRTSSIRSASAALILASMTAVLAHAQQPFNIISITKTNPPTGDITNRGYFVGSIGTEIRAYKDGHHFLSVLTTNGIQAFRPHPGVDIDGWGPSLYLQPFIDGAILANALYPTVSVITNNGVPAVRVTSSGLVSRGTNQTYGNWTSAVDFTYDPTNKTVNGSGTYNVSNPGILLGVGDMTFFKLADNYMFNVPALDGTTTNTGDTIDYAELYGDALVPPTQTRQYALGNHNPQDWNSVVMLGASGNYNVVDAVRMLLPAIKPAAKPSLRITMQAADQKTKILAGVGFLQIASPYADNVGLVGYIKQTDKLGSPWTVTNYNFNVTIDSSAIPLDTYSSEITIATEGLSSSYQGLYFTPNLGQPFTRIGSMTNSGSTFTGVFKIGASLPKGFFRAKEEQ